jgi:hypothetical protein
VWQEAVLLNWVRDWDEVLLQGPPGPRSTFTVTDELRSFNGRFTTFDPPAGTGSPASLAWSVDDGSSGTLFLVPTGTQTRATFTGVSVPHGLDQIFSLIFTLVPGRAKRMSDEESAKDLRVLELAAARRARGRRIFGHLLMARQMAALCQFGWTSADPDSLPEFNDAGELRLDPGETVLATTAAVVVSTAAKGASGREQFETLWRSDDNKADVALTDRRLVYRERGAPERSAAVGRTEVSAGHIRHAHVANLFLGDGSNYGLPNLPRVTATVFEPPDVGIRVHLLLDGAQDLARTWVRAIAGWRVAQYPDLARPDQEHGRKLRAQLEAPQFIDGYWGPMAVLPLYCPLGSATPQT